MRKGNMKGLGVEILAIVIVVAFIAFMHYLFSIEIPPEEDSYLNVTGNPYTITMVLGNSYRQIDFFRGDRDLFIDLKNNPTTVSMKLQRDNSLLGLQSVEIYFNGSGICDVSGEDFIDLKIKNPAQIKAVLMEESVDGQWTTKWGIIDNYTASIDCDNPKDSLLSIEWSNLFGQ